MWYRYVRIHAKSQVASQCANIGILIQQFLLYDFVMRNKFVFKLISNYKPPEHNNIYITSIHIYYRASHLTLLLNYLFALFYCINTSV